MEPLTLKYGPPRKLAPKILNSKQRAILQATLKEKLHPLMRNQLSGMEFLGHPIEAVIVSLLERVDDLSFAFLASQQMIQVADYKCGDLDESGADTAVVAANAFYEAYVRPEVERMTNADSADIIDLHTPGG